MNGPKHYAEAERCLTVARNSDAGSPTEHYNLAAAQVHATLALAAATAYTAITDCSLWTDVADSWREVIA